MLQLIHILYVADLQSVHLLEDWISVDTQPLNQAFVVIRVLEDNLETLSSENRSVVEDIKPVKSGLIRSRVKPKTVKIGIHSLPAWRSALN